MKAVFLALLCTGLAIIGLASCAGVHYAEVPCESVAGIVVTGNVTCHVPEEKS